MVTKDYNHWQLSFDDENICWLGFAKAKSNTNTFDALVLQELADILTQVEKNERLQGLVIFSAQTKGFIAGADIEQFKSLDSKDKILEFLALGQTVFAQLEQLRIPTVAMIDGFCLGGGTELVLACDYRIAESSRQTFLSLPEVNLGIYPGWGGTVRLPRLLGPLAALDIILTGRKVSAKQAKRMGLVDDAQPSRQLTNAARHFILQKPAKQQASWWQRLLNQAPLRSLVAALTRRQLRQKVQESHYPSPFKVVDNFEQFGPNHADAYKIEREALADVLLQNDTAKELIRIFFLRERMKSLAKASAAQLEHIHVVGAGTMGGDIAAWCALQGFTVTLQDRKHEAIAPAIGRAYKLYRKKLKDPVAITRAFDRLIPDQAGTGIHRADVIIEAVFEDLQVKQDLLAEIERQAKPEAIIATNTSSIPLDEINTALNAPERLVGIHFFNPVARMPLVEVVVGEKTAASVRDAACAFVQRIDRLPLPVKSSPGFLVNRILMPYLMEAFAIYQDGVPPEAIDAAAEQFGMPIGPIELADTIGLDICLSVANNLSQYYGGSVPEQLKEMVEAKHLGRKTKRGFYRYKQGKAVKRKVADTSRFEEITQRLILRMVNESAACLDEGVVADADLLDAGMIFGTGFAPFRGGTMRYAEKLGKATLEKQFAALEHQFGERFAPAFERLL